MEQSNSILHYISLFFAVLFSISISELAMLVSIFVGLVTAGVNWYYKHKNTKLAEARLELERINHEQK
ncbi:HP1 family phage holin [Dasania marina]|uniref:HP1 family phage holin n=1 Tax=Dasania marina TaxID=471499 RepID=UPI0003762A7A|nr:HP1 family phage holin [Dasania marina]